MTNQKQFNSMTRRNFIAGMGSAALTFSILKPHQVRGTQANSKIKLGMIGCGGRGTWIADLFQQHGGYELVAAADYFQGRVDQFGEKFNIPAKKRFTGLSGYQKLLDSKVDAIAIETPPYFHPEQAAAGVAAGVHVFLSKPIAVDVPGCLSVAESGKKATAKKLCFLIDFQTRAHPTFIEAMKRIHQGAIGDFAWGEATYHADSPFERMYEIMAANPDGAENRLQARGLDRALSGDIITEQNIHTLDVANWIMQVPPVSAVGTGGKKVRTDAGNCFDHFVVIYKYPNGVTINFSSRQFKGWDTPEGIKNRMFGNKGVLETEYGGQVLIRGENFYNGGRTNQIYKEGAVNNIAAFHQNMMNGNYENSTVKPSVQSNLITVMGRMAAYTGQEIKWESLLKSEERLIPLLDGLEK
ncbi:Gfo/Idh/MocA family oxidoreductase [candidate division KSB1 bacterium]|nr:Gfo/Idh/MocA family oxidoreductase [candidate division KSB1 bacterium]